MRLVTGYDRKEKPVPLSKVFTEHPDSVGETYLEHMRSALSFSFTMARSAACCVVHAFLPFLFKRTGSNAVHELSKTMFRGQRSQLTQKHEIATIESDLCI